MAKQQTQSQAQAPRTNLGVEVEPAQHIPESRHGPRDERRVAGGEAAFELRGGLRSATGGRLPLRRGVDMLHCAEERRRAADTLRGRSGERQLWAARAAPAAW